MLLVFTMLTTFQLEISKTSFLSAMSHLTQLWLLPFLIAEGEGIGKIFILLIQEADCMLYGKLKFQVLSFNSSDRCRGTIVYTKCFEFNAFVLCCIKRQNRSPFFGTNWYLFHQIPYVSSPVFRPSHDMNKSIPDINGPCRSLVKICLYSIDILIWDLNKFCRFLSLLMFCNGP